MTPDTALVRCMVALLLLVFCSVLHRAERRPLNPDELRWLEARGLRFNPERNSL